MEYAAKLAAGLRNYSRTMMKLGEQKLDLKETLLALIVDKLSVLTWQNTEDARHGRNFPTSIYEELTKEPSIQYAEFKSGAEFMEAWNNA